LAAALRRPVAVLAEPVRDHEHGRAGRRHPGGRLHLLGVGQHGHRQRGVGRPEPRAGLAAIVATLVLVGTYVIVSIAAQAYAGPDLLVNNSDDVLSALGDPVLGSPLDKLLIIAVLTSASASTQTTILPTTRTV